MLKQTLAGIVILTAASQAHATLVSLGPASLSGQGLGAVNTVLTMQSPGASTTESGCVAAGVGGTTVTGAAACPGAGPFGLTPFTGGNEQAINEARSASSIGLTNFADLRILFNAAEPGGNSITLDNLALTLWDPATGLILDARYIGAAIDFPTTNPGVGNAGFFFGLDAAQASQANLILSAFPGLFIGLSANASDATGGLETFSIGVAGGVVVTPPPPIGVPEPMTLGLLGSGLLGLGIIRRKRDS